MSKKNKRRKRRVSEIVQMRLFEPSSGPAELQDDRHSKRSWLWPLAGIVFLFVLGVGVFAKNGWLPRTDAITGKRTGWFGKEVAKNAPSSWNPLAFSPPPPTTSLSKEYIYAGSRLLAVEDANASAVPPADLTVWRPSTGTWYVLGGPGSQQTFYGWGQNGDQPVQGDYDGDGKTDFAIYRPSTNAWWIVKSSDGTYYNQVLGATGDVMVPADYDGDGKTDVAVFRITNGYGYWYIQPSSNPGTTTTTQYGLSGDTPAPADYDGDGKADIGVYRGSSATFYAASSLTLQTMSCALGTNGDIPVSADFDGDGKADYALFRNSNATWYIYQSSNAQTLTVQWGASGDQRVQNDYDADGKVDIAVWRPSEGNWYIRQSHDLSLRAVSWGTNGDTAVPAYFRR